MSTELRFPWPGYILGGIVVVLVGFYFAHPGVFVSGTDCTSMHEVYPHTQPTLGKMFRVGSDRWEVTGVYSPPQFQGIGPRVLLTEPGEIWDLYEFGGDRWNTTCGKLARREYSRRSSEPIQAELTHDMLLDLEAAGLARRVVSPPPTP